MKLIIGLINLLNPFGSIIESSKNKIAIIGERADVPGFVNQTEPKTPNKIGVKK